MIFNMFVSYIVSISQDISDYMSTSIINIWCNNLEVTVPAKLPKVYVIVIFVN